MEKKKMRTDRPILNGKEKYVRILIRRKVHGTNAEESRRLLAAGYAAASADASLEVSTGNIYDDHSLHVRHPEEFLPSWSVIGLFHMLPIAVEDADGECRLNMTPFGTNTEKKWLVYYGTLPDVAIYTEGSLIPAVVEMLCELKSLPL